jgi:hypothetical protein
MIRTLKTIFVIILCLGAQIGAGQELKSQTGPHEGRLEAMNGYYVELVTAYKSVSVFLYDGKMKVLPNKNMKCEATLIYPDGIHIKVRLKQFDVNGFFSEVGGTGFSACIITFEKDGKRRSVKFENEYVVQKNNKVKQKK